MHICFKRYGPYPRNIIRTYHVQSRVIFRYLKYLVFEFYSISFFENCPKFGCSLRRLSLISFSKSSPWVFLVHVYLEESHKLSAVTIRPVWSNDKTIPCYFESMKNILKYLKIIMIWISFDTRIWSYIRCSIKYSFMLEFIKFSYS